MDTVVCVSIAAGTMAALGLGVVEQGADVLWAAWHMGCPIGQSVGHATLLDQVALTHPPLNVGILEYRQAVQKYTRDK